MAEVFLARLVHRLRPGGSRFFALKVLRPDLCKQREYVDMFRDEGELHKMIVHPGTVQVFETGSERGQYYIAMELLTGASLIDVWEDCQRAGARMQPDILAWMGARVAETLHFAHDLLDERGRNRHIVHRDVNPANIFLTFDGRVKVIDFGLAKADERLTETDSGIVKGKLAYLAPEQVDGASPDPRTDVFSLGITLWELAADRRLFRHDDDIETVRRVARCEVPDPREFSPYLSTSLVRTLTRALAKDPKKRYQTARDFAKDLDGVVRELGYDTGPTAIAEMLFDICEWGRT